MPQTGAPRVFHLTLKTNGSEKISGDFITFTLESDTVIRVSRTDVVTHEPVTQAPEAATPSTDAFATIQAKCARDWPRDFATRAYCERTQTEAMGKLRARSMTTGSELTIREECARAWPDDFSTRNYCEESQLKALQALRRER